MKLNNKIAIAITPSKDRHRFLELQLDAFWAPYQELRKREPETPDLKWIIVDESSAPCETFQDLKDPSIHYIHLPNREHLDSVPEIFRDICRDCLFDEPELKKRVENLANNPLSNRFIVAHDPWLPSIGEMRNIGISIARSLYGDQDPHAIVLAKDDDDYSSPQAVLEVYNHLKTASFAKFGNMRVHDAVSSKWFKYSYSDQDKETYVLESGKESIIPRYVVWDDKDQKVENPYKHAGIYGLAFTYRLDDACTLGEKFRDDFGKFGPFRPLSRREDVQFFMDMTNFHGEERMRIINNSPDMIVRIVHNNTTRTMHNGEINSNEVSNFTKHGVNVLCGKPTPTEIPYFDPCNQLSGIYELKRA